MASELRKKILKVLILISSTDLQIAYQNSMPHATLSSELIGLWDLEYFPGDKDFKASFHKLEKEALSDFYKVFEGIANDIDYCVPEIDKFVETKPWKRFSECSGQVFLDTFLTHIFSLRILLDFDTQVLNVTSYYYKMSLYNSAHLSCLPLLSRMS